MIAKLVELRLEEEVQERKVFWELRVFDQPDKYILDIGLKIFRDAGSFKLWEPGMNLL